MKSVFEYVDYRHFLQDFFEARKSENHQYSYREFAESLQIDTSNLHKILHSKAHLPARCLPFATSYLGLVGRSTEYFMLLVNSAKERRHSARMEILEHATALREVACRPIDEHLLERYFGDWWVVAIRSLLEVVDGRASPQDLSRRLVPQVDPADVSQALEALLALGMVRKAASDRLVPADAHITTSKEIRTRAVKHYQERIFSLASESVQRFDASERDISTITMSIDAEAFSRIQDVLKECRRQIQIEVDDAKKPDRVMQLCMAFFPLAPKQGASA